MATKKKRPRDLNELAASLVRDAIGEGEPEEEPKKEKKAKNPAAVELGRLGGKKGGKARAKKLTPEQRREIAQIAAAARWKKNKD